MSNVTARQGPRLTVVGTCDGCPRLAIVGAWTFCRSYDPALNNDSDPDSSPGTLYGVPPVTPSWCPELPAARLAPLVDLARTVCRRCGRNVEPERECYAIPTCFACLPPPPPLPVLPSFAEWVRKQEESAVSGAGEESDER